MLQSEEGCFNTNNSFIHYKLEVFMNLLAIVKVAWTLAEPGVRTAGHVAVAVGSLYTADKLVRIIGKVAGKGIDSARRLVGYTNNLFSSNKPTASGNRKQGIKSTTIKRTRRRTGTRKNLKDVTEKSPVVIQ